MIARKIHPQTIIAGWRAATKASREALLKAAVDHGLVTYTCVVILYEPAKMKTAVRTVHLWEIVPSLVLF